VDGWGAFALAAAAGLNPWLTLLITAGLAVFTSGVRLTPTGAWLVSPGLVALLAVLLGLDVVASKVPRLQRPVERLSGPAAALVGGVLGLAVPNAVLPVAPAAAFLLGALVASATRLGRRWAALRLRAPLQGYRFGYAFATLVTNTLAAVVTAATLAILAVGR
jgi:Domain of unknown function (DUF4126)